MPAPVPGTMPDLLCGNGSAPWLPQEPLGYMVGESKQEISNFMDAGEFVQGVPFRKGKKGLRTRSINLLAYVKMKLDGQMEIAECQFLQELRRAIPQSISDALTKSSRSSLSDEGIRLSVVVADNKDTSGLP